MLPGFVILLQIVLAISIIVKGYLHSHIAYRNKINLGAGGGLPFQTLWFFTKPVAAEYESLKEICNYLQLGNIILLLVIFAIYILL